MLCKVHCSGDSRTELDSYHFSARHGRHDGNDASPRSQSETSFFLLERHLAQVAWSLNVLNLICIPQSTHALDQAGVEPRQAVSPRPGGQGRYRFATASVTCSPALSWSHDLDPSELARDVAPGTV